MFKNFTWGHGIVIALGLFMAFILFMIFIFTRGWQNAEMISENYYEDELAYQKVIDAKKNAETLPLKPEFFQNIDGIKIFFKPGNLPDSKRVKFQLFRTDDAKLDVKNEAVLDAQNALQIPKKILIPGSYTLKVTWLQNSKPYQLDYDISWK